MKVKVLVSCVPLFATPWTVACQAPLSMEFSRQEYWRIPSPVDLLDPGIKPQSLALQTDSLPSDLNPTSAFLIYWLYDLMSFKLHFFQL